MVKEMRAERHGERAEKSALRAARHWWGVEGATRAGLRIGGPLARRTRRGRALPGAGLLEAAADPPRRRGGGLRPLLHQPDLRRLAGRGAGRGLAAGRPAGLDPGGRQPAPAAGCPGARKASARPTATRPTRWSRSSGAGAARGRCRSSSTPPPAPRASPRPERASSTRSTPSASPRSRSSTRSPGRTTACCPGWRSTAGSSSATVHPTCATRHLGLAGRLRAIAGELADDVYVAPSATCCGFAGDRGISHPELTEAATRPQAEELAGRDFDAHLSSNRTCEIGLARATGEEYESFLFLLERLTRPD